MIGPALYSILSTTGAVTALIGARVYPNIVPQKKNLPCAYYVTDNVEPMACRTPNGAFTGSFEVVAMSDSYDKTRQIIAAVRTALDGYDGLAAGFSFRVIGGGIELPDEYDETLTAHIKSLQFQVLGQKIS